MPGDPSVVNGKGLDELVREIVAEVLVIPADRVVPGSALIRALGAESIDFMDLVFRLEDALDTRIPSITHTEKAAVAAVPRSEAPGRRPLDRNNA